MEYHNYNKTPIDRIDEVLMKELADIENNNTFCKAKSYKASGRNLCASQRCRYRNVNEGGCGEMEDSNINENSCNCRSMNNRCNSGNESPLPNGVHLSMLYSPHHDFDDLYEIEEGFARGTMFKLLEFPFYMASCRGINNASCDCCCDKNIGGKR